MAKNRIGVTTTKIERDSDGNIISTQEKSHIISKVTGGEIYFTKMFRDDLGLLYGVSRNAMMVFMEMASKIKMADQQIYMGTIEKREIVERTGIPQASIYNCLSELCKAQLLTRVVNSVFMVNPYLFGTGSDISIIDSRNKWNSHIEVSMMIKYKTDENGEILDRKVSVHTNEKTQE